MPRFCGALSRRCRRWAHHHLLRRQGGLPETSSFLLSSAFLTPLFFKDFFHAALLALLEKAEGGFVGLVHGAAVGFFELHEAAVGAAIDADGAKEFHDFHFAAIE